MQFRNLFVTLFGTKAKAAVLQTLVRFPSKKWTGRELAQAAGISAPQAGEALAEFERQSLISRRIVGKSALWSLNHEHVLVRLLEPLARLPEKQKKVLLDEIKQTMDLRRVRQIRLFGSMARGEEEPSSDIDLLFIVKKAKDKERVRKASLEFDLRMAQRWGNVGSVLVFDRKEYESKRALPLIQNIEREGITIYGGNANG